MKKQAMILSAALALGLGSVPALGVGTGYATTSADFTDLKDLDAATKAKFDALISAGIFDGVSDSTFGLKEEMNRAQFAKVAALIFGLEVDPDLKTSSFSDVSSDDAANGYALPYIEALKKAGITNGTGDGSFNPAGVVTKEQLAAFLVRGLGVDSNAKPEADKPDGTVSDWAKEYVSLALELKLLSNGMEGKFGGQANATRDLLLTGAYETAKQNESTEPLSVQGADFTEGNTLKLTLSAAIDENSVDLTKILVNGVPLDPSKDSFTLSDDKKSLIIKLHDGFTIDLAKQPTIGVEGLKTIFGNEVKNDAEKPFTVTVTAPPVGSTSSAAASSGSSTPARVHVPELEMSLNDENGVFIMAKGDMGNYLYYLVYPKDERAPSAARISEVDESNPLSGNRALVQEYETIILTDLPPETDYVLYAVEKNEKGELSRVSRLPFKTAPLDSEGPADPTDPTDPTNPTDPTDPTDPTNPEDPINLPG